MSSSQLFIKLITKNNKKTFFCIVLQVTTFVSQMRPIIVILWKEYKNLQKGAILQKSRKTVLWKLVVPRRKTIWGNWNRYEEHIIL